MDVDGEDNGTKVTRANYLRIVLGGSDQGVMMLACKALGMCVCMCARVYAALLCSLVIPCNGHMLVHVARGGATHKPPYRTRANSICLLTTPFIARGSRVKKGVVRLPLSLHELWSPSYSIKHKCSRLTIFRLPPHPGHLALSGGTLTGDFAEFEVKRALEWLQGL